MRTKTSAGATHVWRTCILAVILITLLAGVAQANRAITKIDVTNQADRVIIGVQGNGPLRVTPLASKSGSYLGFQFPCKLIAKGRLVGIHGGNVYGIRYSNFSSRPAATRIVVNTSKHVNYATDWSADRSHVDITVMKSSLASVPSKPVRVAEANPIDTPVEIASLILPAQGMKTIESPAAEAQPVIAPVAAPIAKAAFRPADKPAVIASASVATQPLMSILDNSTATFTRPTAKVLGMAETAPSGVVVPGAPSVSGLSTQPAVLVRVASIQPTASSEKSGRRVSLNFLAADINDVLKALSVQSGHNIVASKDVTGNVTVSLSNVSMDEAMDYVAKLSGYTYTKDNDTYLVSSKENLRTLAGGDGNGLVTETIKLAFTRADDVIALAKGRFPEIQIDRIGTEITGKVGLESKGGKTGIALRNNLLVLTGPAEQVAAAKQLINTFEDAFKVQSIESTRSTYKVKYVDASELADTLAQLIPGIGIAFAPSEGFKYVGPKAISVGDSGSSVEQDDTDKAMKTENSGQKAQAQTGLLATTGSEAGTSSTVSRMERISRPDTLIIVGREAEVERAIALAAELDVKTPQIKIDAKITSISESGAKKLGVKWDWNSFTVLEGFTDFDKVTNSDPMGGLNTHNVKRSNNQFFKQPLGFSATLDALIQSGNGKLLASPSLVCMEGKPGVFFVGDEVTYIVSIEQTATGRNVTTESKQVGVQLRAIGKVSPDGFITLNLHPEVSVLKLASEEGVTLPIVTRRFTDHVVRVKSGDTFVIGGLIRNDEITEMSKVPLLGDLPFLGSLFKHTDKTNAQTEVVMFITATAIKE